MTRQLDMASTVYLNSANKTSIIKAMADLCMIIRQMLSKCFDYFINIFILIKW